MIDQPVQLMLVTTTAQPVGIVAAEANQPDSLFLQQDIVEPQCWYGTFWPRQAGWHQVARAGGELHWFYVYEKTNWSTWQAAQKVAATQRRIWQSKNLDSKTDVLYDTSEAISLVWFFALFLTTSACLWVERKW